MTPQAAPPVDLPIPLTQFVGRARELEELVGLVGSTRLLTLTGPGGSGKTRLAAEVALRLREPFTRIAWVDLAPLEDAALLPEHVGAALRLADRPDCSSADAVARAIGGERLLLVLDNCEHLVDPCARFVESVLRASPSTAILATSREALGVSGETAWLVPPLVGDEAAQLFVDRARAALPAFEVTAANRDALHEICRRLDGVPLAIELAAARVRVLSLEQIAQRLDDAFRLLTSGSRTALPRHRTLRATMEWSYGLLGTREQVLLRRLSVLAGSFTLDAAEAICAGDPLEPEDILDGVTALADKSLVMLEPCGPLARYRLLETVRQYARERLAEAGEADAFARRHAGWFLAMLEEAAPTLVGGSNAPGVLARVAAEHDNMRAAATWAVADPSRAEIALRFVGAQFWFWYALGQFRELRQLADKALAIRAEVSPEVRGRALLSSALTALAQGDYPLACAQFEEAIPLLTASGDRAGIGVALAKLGAAQLLGGDALRAVRTLDDAIAFTRGAPSDDVPAIFARFWRSVAAYTQGEYDLAHALMSPNVELGRRHDQPTTLAHALVSLARIELARGNVEEACALVLEGLELEARIDDAWGIGIATEVVALVAARRGRPEDAAILHGGTEAHRRHHSVALSGIAPAERDAAIAHLRTVLGARFDMLYAAGLARPTAETVSLALAEAARHTAEHRVPPPRPSREVARPRLRVHALGPLQVWVGERLVEPSAWGSARPRELLAYLLIHPEGRTREQVGLAFWPDASPSQLRNNFHVTLHRLRRALGTAEWVALSGDRYRIVPEAIEQFDVASFEGNLVEARRSLKRQQEGAVAALEQALGHYRGDFLDGEPAGDWHLEHRERLQRLYVEALMELGGRLAAEERHAKAAEAYRRVLARDELHEEALLALMRCHARLGERSQALRAYRRFAERLRAELEAEPGAALARYAERLAGGMA